MLSPKSGESADAESNLGASLGSEKEKQQLLRAEQLVDEALREVRAVEEHRAELQERAEQARRDLREAERVAAALTAHELAQKMQASANRMAELEAALIAEWVVYEPLRREMEAIAAAATPPYRCGDAHGAVVVDSQAYKAIAGVGGGILAERSLLWHVAEDIEGGVAVTLRGKPAAEFPALVQTAHSMNRLLPKDAAATA
jgi:hypothetical protein